MQLEKVKSIISRIFGDHKKVSNEYLYYCKYCNFHKPKLSINYENNVWKCWVCEKSGKNILSLIREFGNQEDINEFSSFYQVSIPDIDSLLNPENKVQYKSTCELPSEYCFIGNFESNDSFIKDILSYLKKRDVLKFDIIKYKIGVCRTGNYTGRLIFPSFNKNGDVNFYVAQSIDDKNPYKWLYPKILKSQIVFNELLIDWSKPIYICEGIFDYIKLNQIVDNVIPLIGKTIVFDEYGYSQLIDMIIKNSTRVNLCLDSDKVKGNIINRSLELSRVFLNFNIDCNIIKPDPWKDFGEVPLVELPNIINNIRKIESNIDIIENKLQMWR